MPTLKVYCIGNLDGRHSAIIAAHTKAAACEALGVRGGAKSEVCVATDDLDREAREWAHATPGIPWEKPIHYGRGGPSWRCRDELAGAKAIVRARFPGAVCTERTFPIGWAAYESISGRAIGDADTHDAAWLEAARILSLDPPGLPDNAIVIWRPEDAPWEFRALEAGDTEWVAFVPPRLAGERLWSRLEASGPVRRFPVRRGEVRICVHEREED